MFTQNIVKGFKVCQNSRMMEISQVQYERIADCFPVHRGNVAYDNLRVLNAILYVLDCQSKSNRQIEKSLIRGTKTETLSWTVVQPFYNP